MRGASVTYARGLRAPEGPAFDRAGNLYVTELEGSAVQCIAPDGTVREFVQTGGRPNGLAFHRDGDLYVADADLGAILRVPPDGCPYLLADAGDLPFRNPNDLTFDSRGGLYLTDPVTDSCAPDGRIYHIDADGDVHLFADGLRFPNGLALLPDGSALYVAESRTGFIHEFKLDGPTRFSAHRIRARVDHSPVCGGPDGMAFADDGTLYIALANFGVVAVVTPDDRLPDYIEVGAGFPTNLAFGGPERSSLFITEIETGTVRVLRTQRSGALLFGDSSIGTLDHGGLEG